MRTLLRTIPLAATAALATAQIEVHGAPPIAELIRHTQEALAEHTPQTGAELARIVVAHLRLGDVPAARQKLLDYAACDEPALILCAHATFARTTGNTAMSKARRTQLERALTKAEQPPALTFSDAMLLVHGRYCFAQLCDSGQRAHHERRATTRLLALEAETWQPGRGYYRPTPCNGRLLVPEAADASLLVPHSFGMLIATGDRLTRHLDGTLRAREDRAGCWQQVLPQQQPALLLLAAAQLGDHERLARAFPAVVSLRATEPELAALNLSAVLHAVTGARLAAGAGLSDRWLHLKPWLPGNCNKLEVRGMLAQCHRLQLTLQRANANATTTVKLKTNEPEQLPVVVANRWQQFVTTITRELPFACELPKAAPTREEKLPLPARPEPDHDALQRRFRAR